MNLTQQAHDLICENFDIKPLTQPNEDSHKIGNAIDATCGNGNDSVFLAEHSQHLLCFDIQAEAIKKTKVLLDNQHHGCQVECIQTSHANLLEHVDKRKLNGKVEVVMFNLGFLPKGSNSKITTTHSSTVQALSQAMQCLSDNGVISILCYRGHNGGPEEFSAVTQLLAQTESDTWQIQQFDSANATDATPILLFLKKATDNA